jgi:hypothetical protein
MKRMSHPRLAAWLLEHLTSASAADALVGDLLEQHAGGRSTAWLWRQAAAAIGIHAVRMVLHSAPAAVFAAGWGLVYPAWRGVIGAWLPPVVPERWLALPWPRPALLELGYGVVPAVSFVWLGVLMYLLVRRDTTALLPPSRILSGLSAGMNVVMLATWALLNHLQHPDLVCVTSASFYLGFRIMGVSVPLTLGVFVALLVTMRRQPPVARSASTRRAAPARRAARFPQSLHGKLELDIAAPPLLHP